MAAEEKKRRGDIEKNIRLLDAEIRTTKKQLEAMRTASTRARCKVDLVSRSAEKERRKRDSSRNVQQWAASWVDFYSRLLEEALQDKSFYTQAQKRSMGADEVIGKYKSRVRRAELKATIAAAEAQKYSHVGYHAFDSTVLSGFSTDKDALNESRRNYAEVQRRYKELVKAKKKLEAML